MLFFFFLYFNFNFFNNSENAKMFFHDQLPEFPLNKLKIINDESVLLLPNIEEEIKKDTEVLNEDIHSNK